MVDDDQIGEVQLGVRIRGIFPPVTRRLRISEQATPAQLHAALQVVFDWSDSLLYVFVIRGGQFRDGVDHGIDFSIPGGVDIPLAAFGFARRVGLEL